MIDSLLATLGQLPLPALLLQAQARPQLPPLMKVKVYTALILLMVVMLGLIIFNRLMARWARRAGGYQGDRRPHSYTSEDDDWTRRPLIDDDLSDYDD